jgi:hypothetical protein
MRGFLVVACSVLVAIGIGVAAIAGGSGPVTLTSAQSFAQQVLAEATIPPGAQSTSKVVSPWLGGPFGTLGVAGLIDDHRLYLVDSTPDPVERDIEAGLPEADRVTSTGSSGLANGFAVTLPTSGPHEYLAQLTYDLAPVGGTKDTELRVDAQTVWLPSRTA